MQSKTVTWRNNGFQFQYGSIESNRWRFRTRIIANFNSNMVQLRVSFITFSLASGYISIPIWFNWEFEFRYRHNCCKHISIPIWFNWEFRFAEKAGMFLFYFNSNMVQLRVQPEVSQLPEFNDFNSNMVQLRVKEFGKASYTLPRFQFQYGSIERITSLWIRKAFNKISIPIWFNWEGHFPMHQTRWPSISIPIWFNWE